MFAVQYLGTVFFDRRTTASKSNSVHRRMGEEAVRNESTNDEVARVQIGDMDSRWRLPEGRHGIYTVAPACRAFAATAGMYCGLIESAMWRILSSLMMADPLIGLPLTVVPHIPSLSSM